MLNVHLGENIELDWREIVDRELDLSLLRLEQERYSLNLALTRRIGSATEPTNFVCGVTIFDSGDMISDFEIDHSNGRFAIRQALARTRRTLARREGLRENSPGSSQTASVVQFP